MVDLYEVYETITRRLQREEEGKRQDPLVRIWDGNWKLFTEVQGYSALDFEFLKNDAGTASFSIELTHPVAELLMANEDWPTRSLYLTIDKDGARWSGRLVSCTVEEERTGKEELQVTFIHDYIKLKEILVWSNPFLPEGVQFPKAWFLYGPSKWVVATTLFVNLLRKNLSLWKVPDNPLDVLQWVDLDLSDWTMVVKPQSFRDDSSLTAAVTSRFKYFHDCVADVCHDAQLSIEVRRYLEGDEPPIKGFKLRHGCLVVDVVDKSGWYRETAYFGTITRGLTRAIRRVTSDGLTEGLDYVQNPNVPEPYKRPWWKGSLPEAPWVVLDDGPYTGIRSTHFEYAPPGASQFVTGGSSMPGVNEAIKTSITAFVGMFGALFNQSQIGEIAANVTEPLWSDVFAAFQVWKDHQRIKEQGWDFPFEQWVDGSDKAYTLSSFMAVRAAKNATSESASATVKMENGAPYWVGPQGHGDFWIGDRVAIHAKGMTEDRLLVQHVESLKFELDDKNNGWTIEIGQSQFTSGFDDLVRRYGALTEGLRALGVW